MDVLVVIAVISWGFPVLKVVEDDKVCSRSTVSPSLLNYKVSNQEQQLQTIFKQSWSEPWIFGGCSHFMAIFPDKIKYQTQFKVLINLLPSCMFFKGNILFWIADFNFYFFEMKCKVPTLASCNCKLAFSRAQLQCVHNGVCISFFNFVRPFANLADADSQVALHAKSAKLHQLVITEFQNLTSLGLLFTGNWVIFENSRHRTQQGSRDCSFFDI